MKVSSIWLIFCRRISKPVGTSMSFQQILEVFQCDAWDERASECTYLITRLGGCFLWLVCSLQFTASYLRIVLFSHFWDGCWISFTSILEQYMLKHVSSNTMCRSRNPSTVNKKPNKNVCKTIFTSDWFQKGSYLFSSNLFSTLVFAKTTFETK